MILFSLQFRFFLARRVDFLEAWEPCDSSEESLFSFWLKEKPLVDLLASFLQERVAGNEFLV